MRKHKIECLIPTNADVEAVLTPLGSRNHGGSADWFNTMCVEKQANDKPAVSFNELAKIIITIWEAGRFKAGKTRRNAR